MKIRALGEWVFIKRDKQEKTFLGLNISGKGLTKNQNGCIEHSVNNQLVGKRVHIPHYRVIDYDLDGNEYAVIRESDLFAIEESGSFRPINRHVKIRKCENDHIRDIDGKIVLYNTDRTVEETNWVEILDVSDNCNHLTKDDIGMFCIAPERSENLKRLLYSKDYMLEEDAIEFVTGD